MTTHYVPILSYSTVNIYDYDMGTFSKAHYHVL